MVGGAVRSGRVWWRVMGGGGDGGGSVGECNFWKSTLK